MPSPSPDRIAQLLQPYLESTSVPATLFLQLGAYLDLLLKWNARTNLTAIRDPESIITRYFGESLFLAAHLPPGIRSVLDLGSGAGFPGLPLQFLRPELTVTLAESQHKKSAFLQEVVRSLRLNTTVHAGRAEELVGKHRFDGVVLRAVDRMQQALDLAGKLGGTVLVLTSVRDPRAQSPTAQIAVPQTDTGLLLTFPGLPLVTEED